MFIRKIATAAATGALLLSAFAPSALATTNVTISGNGRNSTNTANITKTNITTVNQTNNSAIITGVSSSANTGGNTSHDNDGGGSISTGQATSTVGVSVGGSSNTAVAPNCGCRDDSIDVNISGNKRMSKNTANVNSFNHTGVSQTNNSFVGTFIDSSSNSGGNTSHDNSGLGFGIMTDPATSTVGVGVTGPMNSM